MEQITPPTQEEMQQMLEKAKRELQEKLASMTPEERAKAAAKAKQVIEEDRAAMQSMVERAREAAAGGAPEKARPKFCSNCGSSIEA